MGFYFYMFPRTFLEQDFVSTSAVSSVMAQASLRGFVFRPATIFMFVFFAVFGDLLQETVLCKLGSAGRL